MRDKNNAKSETNKPANMYRWDADSMFGPGIHLMFGVEFP